jgi:hypothetical protein
MRRSIGRNIYETALMPGLDSMSEFERLLQLVLLASARHGAGKPQFGPPWMEDGRTYTFTPNPKREIRPN